MAHNDLFRDVRAAAEVARRTKLEADVLSASEIGRASCRERVRV